jgi:7,8-dihydroneopterin aldolase/epimerase/oxygenase
MIWQIKLNNVSFIAQHGMYAEEQILGNTFIVNIAVHFEKNKIETLNDSIDYVTIYNIVSEIMAQKEALLETVIQKIEQNITNHFNNITQLDISIKKLQPYFGKNIESSEVSIVKRYKL